MMDENQTPMTNGTSDGAGTQAAGNPFAGDNGQGQQASTNNGVNDAPSWLQVSQAEETPKPTSDTPQSTFDPFSNPFDTGAPASQDAPTVSSPTPVTYVEEEAQPKQQPMAPKSSDNAMDLLTQIQERYAHEEADYQETLQMHEENIKAEQEAIRLLRQARREEKESMKRVIMGLETMLGMTREKSTASKEEAPKKAPKKSEKKVETHAAKKIDTDDFFSAA